MNHNRSRQDRDRGVRPAEGAARIGGSSSDGPERGSGASGSGGAVTGVEGGAGLPAPFVWGVRGLRGSRALRACLFFSTLTRYPRLFADVSSQFFSYGESHPHPHPRFLRNSRLETWCGGAARDPGFRHQVSSGAPLPSAFPSLLFSILNSPVPAPHLPARRPTSPLLPEACFSPCSSLFPCVFTCS